MELYNIQEKTEYWVDLYVINHVSVFLHGYILCKILQWWGIMAKLKKMKLRGREKNKRGRERGKLH